MTLENTRQTKPYRPPARDVIIDPLITVSAPVYPLDRADYLVLTRTTRSGVLVVSATACFGFALSLGIEWVARIVAKGEQNQMEVWKIWALAISILVSVLCMLAIWLAPDERKRLLRKIERELQSKPRRIESHRRRDEE